jgi:hypothetical protein
VTARRHFGEVVTELATSLATDHVPPELFRITTLVVELPVEVALVRSGDDIAFVADVPRWRWRSDFDRSPSRLVMRIGEGSVV